MDLIREEIVKLYQSESRTAILFYQEKNNATFTIDPVQLQEMKVKNEEYYGNILAYVVEFTQLVKSPVEKLIIQKGDIFGHKISSLTDYLLDFLGEKLERLGDSYVIDFLGDEEFLTKLREINNEIQIDDLKYSFFTLTSYISSKIEAALIELSDEAIIDLQDQILQILDYQGSYEAFEEQYHTYGKRINDENSLVFKLNQRFQAPAPNYFDFISNQLEEVLDSNIIFSEAKLRTAVLRYAPIHKDSKKEVNFEEGIDIFAQSILSEEVPYLVYLDRAKVKYTRIYFQDYNHDYARDIVDPDLVLKANQLYLKLVDSKVQIVKYDLRNNELSFEIPYTDDLENDKKRIINKVAQVFPSLILSESREAKSRISMEFEIYDFPDYDESIFLQDLLTDIGNGGMIPLIFYLSESIKPVALKNQFDIGYRDYLADYSQRLSNPGLTGKELIELHSVLTRRELEREVQVESSEIFEAMKKKTKRYIPTPSKKIQYFHVTVIGNGYDEIAKFRELLYLIMGAMNKRTQTEAIYELFFRDMKDPREQLLTSSAPSKKVGKGRKGRDRIQELQDKAPEIFKDVPYTTSAQKLSDQPTIINEEDIREASEFEHEGITYTKDVYDFTYKGENYTREVLDFPYFPRGRNKTTLHLVCLDEEQPFPGVKENKYVNRDVYPFLPKCYSKSQIDPPKKTTKTALKNFFEWRDKGETAVISAPEETGGGKTFTTLKLLGVGDRGDLPLDLSAVLQADFVRKGAAPIGSPDAVIYCIEKALGEGKTRTTREMILEAINPIVMKQELYDLNEEEIIEAFNNEWLDPERFYRALEEYYQINLYVFTIPKTGKVKLELPRHRYYHSRHYRERTTVLILKHWGTERDAYNLKFPHCELISGDKTVDVNKICYNLILQGSSTLEIIDNFRFFKNVNYQVDLEAIFSKVNLEYQWIDSVGKCRAITFEVAGKEATIFLPPSQPLNLPMMNDFESLKLDYPYADALKLFSIEPTGYSRSVNDGVIGIWYPLFGIPNGIYFPVKSKLLRLNLPSYTDIVPSLTLNLTDRTRRLERTNNKLIQILQWIYVMLKRQFNAFARVEDFEEYLTVDVQEIDDADYYELDRIPRKLPDYQELKMKMNNLFKFLRDNSNLVNENGIRIYSEYYKQKVMVMLRNYDVYLERLYSEFERKKISPIPRYIEDYYQNGIDFYNYETPKIYSFVEDEFDNWFKTLNHEENNIFSFKIYDKYEAGMKKRREAYFLRFFDNIYLVQNVRDDSFNTCLFVSQTWMEEKINLGYNAVGRLADEERNYVIFGYDPSGKIEPIDDQRINKEQAYHRLLYFGTKAEYETQSTENYAAILKLE